MGPRLDTAGWLFVLAGVRGGVMKHVVAGAGSPVAHVAAPRGPDNRFEGGPEPAGQVDFPPTSG